MADPNLNDFDQPINLTERELERLTPGYLTANREMGMRMLRSAKTEEALRKFHAAAAAFPDDVRNLIGRGQSRHRMKLLKGAKSDAEKVLQLNDSNKQAISLQARCEYELGNAEQALLMFRRGANKRGMRKEFKEGGQAVVATLENCIGRHSGSALLNLQPTIHAMLEQQQRMAEMEGSKKKTQCLEDTKPFYTCSDQAWRKLQLKKKKRDGQIAFAYLGNLANSLELNRKLSTDRDPRIRKIGQQCVRETEDLLAILRDRRPLYHVRHKYKSCDKIIAQQRAKLLENELQRLRENAERMLMNLMEFSSKFMFRECVAQSLRMKLLVDTFPESAAKQKTFHLHALSNAMAGVYFKIKALDPNLSSKDNCIRMGLVMGKNQAFNKISFDWITDSSAFPFFDCKQWIKMFNDFIDVSESDLERAWLHYEVSRAHIILKKWPYVTAEARKAVNYAKRCGQDTWHANALFLMMIAESRRKESEVLEVFNECHAVALKIGNENFLKCLAVAKQVLQQRPKENPYDILAANAKREQTIIRLMDGEEAKSRARDLFARMHNVRADRRMSLVSLGVLPSKKKGGTLSIIPGSIGGFSGLRLQPVKQWRI